MNNNDFALFIDKMRDARNISRENFVEDIISLRQYYRFINGESTLKSDVILELLKRLEMNNSFFYNYFQKTTDNVFRELNKLHHAIYADELKEAKEIMQQVDEMDISDENNTKYHLFLKEVLLVKQNKKNYDYACEIIIDLVDYPNVLEKTVLSYQEKLMLVYLKNYMLIKKDYRLPSFLFKLIQEEDNKDLIMDTEALFMRISTAKSLGYIKKTKESYKVLVDAENRFIKKGLYPQLLDLYFFKAVTEKTLYDDNRYRLSLQNVFALLRLNNNQVHQDKYNNAIQKYFALKESDLIEFK